MSVHSYSLKRLSWFVNPACFNAVMSGKGGANGGDDHDRGGYEL